MAPEEWAQIIALLGDARHVLEWGAGGSTLALLEQLPKLEKLVSVEHDRAWYERLLRSKSDPRLILLLREPNKPPPNIWRLRAEHEPEWLADYVAAPRKLGIAFDAALIDGRARRFCIREALEIVNPGGVVALHDAQRRIYHDVIPAHAEFLQPWTQGQVCVIRT